jgi:hypothetical protein
MTIPSFDYDQDEPLNFQPKKQVVIEDFTLASPSGNTDEKARSDRAKWLVEHLGFRGKN